MTPKAISKLIVDFLMTIVLLLLMAYQMVGEKAHERLGICMLLLFVIHQVLNKNWYGSLFKGKYNIVRIFQTILNFLILSCIAGLMISGIILSKYAFISLSFSNGHAFARTLHMLASYWGFVLMSLHLGTHWRVILSSIKKAIKNPVSVTNARTLKILAIIIAIYGGYAFGKRGIGSYMFLTTQFVFFDFGEPLALFLADYLAIMCLFTFIGYYLVKSLHRIKIRKGK